LFFRLCGIRLSDFEALAAQLRPVWQASEIKRLSRKSRQRAICGGMKYHLSFVEQLLMCLIYYRTYTSHVFPGLVFNVSSPTACRCNRTMTQLMAGHFRLPERKIRLSQDERDSLIYLMIHPWRCKHHLPVSE